jgi:hypothetical protein
MSADKPPTPTERIARAVVAARRAAEDSAPTATDNDGKSIAALAAIVNRALLLVGLVVLVLGGLVGVGVSLRGMGTTITTTATGSP